MRRSIIGVLLIVYNVAVGQAISGFVTGDLIMRSESVPAYIDEPQRHLLSLPYRESLDSLNQSLGGTPQLTYYRGWCHLLNGQIFDAYEDANAYMMNRSADPYFGRILLARTHFARLNKGPALSVLDQATLLQPSKPYAYIEELIIYAAAGDTEVGLELADKCVKKFPEEISMYLYRGLLLSNSNNHKKAIADFNRFIGSDKEKSRSDLALAYFGLAKSLTFTKELDEALKQANNGLALLPDSAPGHAVRGEIFYEKKEYDAALDDFRIMIATMRDSHYLLIIAKTYEAKGDVEMACHYYSDNCRLRLQDDSCMRRKKLKCTD